MNEDLQKIFEGTELTEDFQKKVTDVITSRIEEAKVEADASAEAKYAEIAEQYGQYVVEATEAKVEDYIAEEVLPSIDKFISYAASEFVKENAIAIQSGIKVELAEKFLQGLAGITEQFNVQIPEGQEDRLAEMERKLDEANTRIGKLVSEKQQLEESIAADQRKTKILSLAEGMTETTKERFIASAERVKFIDENQFASALEELKESFVPVADKETLTEKAETEEVKVVTEQKNSYLDSLFAKV